MTATLDSNHPTAHMTIRRRPRTGIHPTQLDIGPNKMLELIALADSHGQEFGQLQAHFCRATTASRLDAARVVVRTGLPVDTDELLQCFEKMHMEPAPLKLVSDSYTGTLDESVDVIQLVNGNPIRMTGGRTGESTIMMVSYVADPVADPRVNSEWGSKVLYLARAEVAFTAWQTLTMTPGALRLQIAVD